jgi:YD repeat-containing protein
MTNSDDDRVASWSSDGSNSSPIFDPDGNMTSGPLEGSARTFVYDSRNRLIQAGTSSYVYDAEDRRIGKTEDGVTTSYIHNPHAELQTSIQEP